MRNLEARIRDRQRAARRANVSALDLDSVLQAHVRRFEAIKLRAEDAHDRAVAYAYGENPKDSPKFERALKERKFQRTQGTDFSDDTFPPYRWYAQTVLPALREIASDPQVILAHSENVLASLEAAAQVKLYEDRERWRAHPIKQTIRDYCAFLHGEDPRLLKSLMLANLRRIDMHGDGGSTPYSSYDLKRQIDQFKASPYDRWLPDVFEIFGNISNGHVAPKFLNNILPILRSFTEGRTLKDADTSSAITVYGIDKDDEENDLVSEQLSQSKAHLIPTYLRLARAAKDPKEHEFNFASTEVFHHIAALDRTDGHFDAAVSLIEAGLSRDAGSFDHRTNVSAIVDAITRLDASYLHDEVPRILSRATALAKEGLHGEVYLRLLAETVGPDRAWGNNDRTYYRRNEDAIVSYAHELSQYSLQAANAYLAQRGPFFGLGDPTPWNLPVPLREQYHETGLRLVREFGDAMTSYFVHATNVLRLDPERFDMWRDRIVRFARGSSETQRRATIDAFINVAHALLRRGSLDATLTATVALDAAIREEDEARRAQGERVDRFDDPICKFLGVVGDIATTDVPVGQFANDFLGLYRGEMYRHVEYLVHHVKDGLNYNVLLELFPTILSGGLLNSIKQIEGVVNAPMAIARKQALLKEYALAAPNFSWSDRPILDLEGKWRDSVRENVLNNLGKCWEEIDLAL